MPGYFYNHIHMFSADPIKASEFWEKGFGGKRIETRNMPDGRIVINLELVGIKVLITQLLPDQGSVILHPATGYQSFDHIGISTDDIDATVATLKAMGAKFKEELKETRPGAKMAWVWGPDNVLIELLPHRNR